MGQMENKKILIISLLSLVVSIGLIAILFSQTDSSQFKHLLDNINLNQYLIAFLIYVFINLIIAFRLCYFYKIKDGKSILASLDIGASHAVALCVLPLRLGDAIYPFLIKRYLNKSLVSSLHNLFVLRVYDFISAVIIFLMLLLNTVFITKVSPLSYAFLVLSILISYVLLKNLVQILSLFINMFNKLGFTGIALKLRAMSDRFEKDSQKLSTKSHLYIFTFSIVRWVFSGLMLLHLCYALNLDIELGQALFLTTGMNMAFIIPLQTVGGIGVLESVLALLITMQGLPFERASAMAISLRLLWFTLPFILGFIWFSGRKLCKRLSFSH